MKTNFIHYIALVLLVCSVGLLGSCKDDDGHNAGSPVVVNRFYPTSGSAGTEILITGKNFTTNVDEVSVMVGNIPLTVLSCDMNNIMAIVPARMGDGRLLQLKVLFIHLPRMYLRLPEMAKPVTKTVKVLKQCCILM